MNFVHVVHGIMLAACTGARVGSCTGPKEPKQHKYQCPCLCPALGTAFVMHHYQRGRCHNTGHRSKLVLSCILLQRVRIFPSCGAALCPRFRRKIEHTIWSEFQYGQNLMNNILTLPPCTGTSVQVQRSCPEDT